MQAINCFSAPKKIKPLSKKVERTKPRNELLDAHNAEACVETSNHFALYGSSREASKKTSIFSQYLCLSGLGTVRSNQQPYFRKGLAGRSNLIGQQVLAFHLHHTKLLFSTFRSNQRNIRTVNFKFAIKRI